ncbi:MAG: metallophosphoesterase [Puniceicoccales bacterium]|jgi:hypothetical protein|nr:metallophosphoesterase [Puniceicoccales bacterium]
MENETANDAGCLVLTGHHSRTRIVLMANGTGGALTLAVKQGGAGGTSVRQSPFQKLQFFSLSTLAEHGGGGAPANCALGIKNGVVTLYHYAKIYLGTPVLRLRFEPKTRGWFLLEDATGDTATGGRPLAASEDIERPPLEKLLARTGADGEASALPPPPPPRDIPAAVLPPPPEEDEFGKSLDAEEARLEFAPFATGAVPRARDVAWEEIYAGGEDEFIAGTAALTAALHEFARDGFYGIEPPTLFPERREAWGKTLACSANGRPVWFIGDLHGDFAALRLATDFARRYERARHGAPPVLFFLGDFIDDGPCSVEVVAWLLAAARGVEPATGDGTKVLAVAGNHDEALVFDEERQCFDSTVVPADFHVALNGAAGALHPFGHAALRLFRRLPRMVFLDSTVLVAHGGVPCADYLPRLRSRADLNSPEALQDFVWTRLHETLPLKTPNRRVQGPCAGYRDFNRFIALAARPEILGATPQLFLRGHDHVPDNWRHFAKYTRCKVLTVNAMCRDIRNAPDTLRQPVITRWTPAAGNAPDAPLDVTVFRLPVPPAA